MLSIRKRIQNLSPLDRNCYEAIADAFEEGWRSGSGTPPDINALVPGNEPLRSLVLVQLVKVDLEARLGRGENVRVEHYLDRFPELHEDRAGWVELIVWEYELLRQRNSAWPDDYFVRFPELVTELRDRLGGGRDQASDSPPGFVLLAEIGRGAFGVVYRAHHEKLNRVVALKVLSLGAGQGASLMRFRREIEIIARLNHPNIVQIHDTGIHNGQSYSVLEYCLGGALDKRLGSVPVPPVEAAQIMRTLALAVQAVHQSGIVHRDLKPANVLIHEPADIPLTRCTLKIADFGLACQAGDTRVTATGALLGTPAYMAPEQTEGNREEIGPSADIWALGAILYQCLTGRPPFLAPSVLETWRLVQEAAVVPPSSLVKIPHPLDVICLKCLEKEPARRYLSASELADDLSRFLDGKPIRARPPGRVRKTWMWCRRHPAWSLLIGFLLIGLFSGVAGGWWEFSERRAANRSAQASYDDALSLLAEPSPAVEFDVALARQALAQAREALAFCQSPRVDHNLRNKAAGLVSDRTQHLRAAEFVSHLEKIHQEKALFVDDEFELFGADVGYVKAFAQFGFDDVMELSAPEIVRRLENRPRLRVRVGAALDDWVAVRRDVLHLPEGKWRPLAHLASQIDPDRVRNSFRVAYIGKALDKLKLFAQHPESQHWPSSTVLLLAEQLRLLGELHLAATVLQKARDRLPDDFWITFTLGNTFHQMRPPRLQEAIRCHTAAVALQPRSPGALLQLGNALHVAGDRAAAVTAFQRARVLAPHFARAHHNLGNVWRELGKFIQAEACYKQAVDIQPRYARAWYHLGLTLWHQKKYGEAAAAYRNAVDRAPNDRFAAESLGLCLLRLKRYSEAAEVFSKLLRRHPDLHTSQRHFRIALSGLNRPREWSITTYLAVLPISREQATRQFSAEDTFKRAEEALLKKDDATAIRALREVLRLDPTYPGAAIDLGMALFRAGRLQEAESALRRGLKTDPNVATGHFHLGTILSTRKAYSEAVRSLRRGLELDPNHVSSRFNLGNALTQLGDTSGSLACYQQVVRMDPSHWKAWHNLGHCLKNQHRFAEAERAFQQVTNLVPTSAVAWYQLGQTRTKSGHFAHALAALERSLELANQSKNPTAVTIRKETEDCKILAELEGRPNVPVPTGLKVRLATFCLRHCARPLLAARLFQDAPVSNSDSLPPNTWREAGVAAAQAGTGLGEARLTDSEQAAWRRRSLTWLSRDLAVWADRIERRLPDSLAQAPRYLESLQRDKDLARVRQLSALKRMGKEERQAWMAFWARVDHLRITCTP